MTAPGLSGRVWQATSMRALTIALTLLATPALAKRHSHGGKTR